MTANVPSSEISDTSPRFVVEIARSPEQLREVFELRHQVYCLERGYEIAVGDQESDEFDSHSHHVLLRDCRDGEVFGTVRLIAPNRFDLANSFPMQRLCEPALLRHLPLSTSGEISRYAISKQRRGGGVRHAGALPRLALVRGLAQLSSELGLTHWMAVMERSLLRLHQRNAISFDVIGPLVPYHGLRQPATCAVATMLDRVKREEFATWNFLTDGGRWYPRPDATASAWSRGKVKMMLRFRDAASRFSARKLRATCQSASVRHGEDMAERERRSRENFGG